MQRHFVFSTQAHKHTSTQAHKHTSTQAHTSGCHITEMGMEESSSRPGCHTSTGSDFPFSGTDGNASNRMDGLLSALCLVAASVMMHPKCTESCCKPPKSTTQ